MTDKEKAIKAANEAIEEVAERSEPKEAAKFRKLLIK